MEEDREPVVFLKQWVYSFGVELEKCVSDLEFTMAEDGSGWIEERGRADVLLWHSDHRTVCKDRPMIAAKVRFVRIILRDN